MEIKACVRRFQDSYDRLENFRKEAGEFFKKQLFKKAIESYDSALSLIATSFNEKDKELKV